MVVSASDYKKTFLKLLDDPSLVPESQREKIRTAAVSQGIFTVYLGLNISNEALNGCLRAFSVYDNALDQDVDYEKADDPDHFSKVPLGVYSPSLVNPALAPQGKSSLMIQAVCPDRWQENWHRDDRQKYRELKDRVKATLIERAERIVPGLRQSVEFEDAATPLTYERYTQNTDGATSAWSWDPRKKFYEGDMMKMSVETPVKNLLIGSCWVAQIGGLPSALAAAYLCAKKIK